MSKQTNMAKLRRRLAKMPTEARQVRLWALARRAEMDQREIAVLKGLECASSR